MGIKLKKIQRANPMDRSQKNWYLTQERTGTVGLKEIATQVAAQSSLTFGDVYSVLRNMVEILPVFLKLGQSIRLEGFGSFHITISSDGKEDKNDLNTSCIKGTRLRFLASSDLKHRMKELSFEILKEKEVTNQTEI